MSYFNRDYLNMFLGVVRKYMQVRGGLSQKDLAEQTETGVSTLSRFLNQKTIDLDPQLIAKIVAKLEIPLHEVIDFIEEESEERFRKLVKFFKDDTGLEPPSQNNKQGGIGHEKISNPSEQNKSTDKLTDAFETLGTAKKPAKATVRIGGRSTTIPFNPEGENKELTLKDKLDRLTPRQKAYISDFLNLDVEGRDLVVDLGSALFRYFRQKGTDF